MAAPPAFVPPTRVLHGPGPSEVAPSVLRALAAPTIGHLDPAFLGLLDAVRSMLRQVIGTENELTLPMSGTGSLGMETCIDNLVEPGDRVLVGIHGVFGQRLAEVARRAGGEVTVVEGEWGRALDVEQVRKVAAGARFKLLCVVHAETSTGALTPLPPFRALADELGALLLVDCVTSLGGVPVEMDAVGADAIYAGTQKCLSCPPGLAPVSFSPRARAALDARKHKVQSWYADLSLIAQYFGGERLYHHTAPINMLYGLHEALRLVLEEGLEARYARHRTQSAALAVGLEAMGLKLAVPAAERLPPLTLVEIPQGIDDGRVRKRLLDEHNIEIGGGLGKFKGRAWRIGLMGESCQPERVTGVLSALRSVLEAEGFRATKTR
ncbi:MAG TPA: alanine--glyoxylate aminotransferase family protein [Polyangiales bacterium]|nr:alanine--glyoxylate aminotransferase family protein [Polyangiales bacterium]